MKKVLSTIALAAVLSLTASAAFADTGDGKGLIVSDLTGNDGKGLIVSDLTGNDGKGLIVSDLVSSLFGLIVSD